MSFTKIGDVFRGTWGMCGDMAVLTADTPQNAKVYIFDSHVAAPVEMDEHSNATEEWMNNSGERLNHQSVQLGVSDFKGYHQLLFHEYGQDGWWWHNADMSKIYILVLWIDFTKDTPTKELIFWSSIDGGQKFYKNYDFTKQAGNVDSRGMYFDKEGKNGYILTGLNTVWQTNNGGRRWTKRYLPHTNAPTLPASGNANNIDTAIVDEQGNLLFSLFQQIGEDVFSNIYEVPVDTQLTDLSQEKPKYILKDKRVLNMYQIPEKQESFYFFYIDCPKNFNCKWSNQEPNNFKLQFMYVDNQEIKSIREFPFFLAPKNIKADDKGLIAVTMEKPSTNRQEYQFFSSYDHGTNWKNMDFTDVNIMGYYADVDKKEYWVSDTNEIGLAKIE